MPPAMTEVRARLLLNRLSRLEGQVRGLRKLLDGRTPCDQLLIQVAALAQGTNAVAAAVLQAHFETCLDQAEDAAGAERLLGEFERSMTRLLTHT